MTVETYVYAMAGVHCKNVCTTTTEMVRGCSHPQTNTKFCAVCGKKMWIINKIEDCLSDKLKHLQLWYGNEEGEVDENAISLIYSPMRGSSDFVVGKVFEEFDAGCEGVAVPFNVLTDEEYTAAYEQTRDALEPLGLWDPEKFGYLLYAICM